MVRQQQRQQHLLMPQKNKINTLVLKLINKVLAAYTGNRNG